MKTEIEKAFDDNGLYLARMIGYSKTFYRQEHPNDEVYFNANIFTKEDGKVWYGDLNLTLDSPRLHSIATILQKELYVLSEHDGRFYNENLESSEIEKRAKSTIGYIKKEND